MVRIVSPENVGRVSNTQPVSDRDRKIDDRLKRMCGMLVLVRDSVARTAECEDQRLAKSIYASGLVSLTLYKKSTSLAR